MYPFPTFPFSGVPLILLSHNVRRSPRRRSWMNQQGFRRWHQYWTDQQKELTRRLASTMFFSSATAGGWSPAYRNLYSFLFDRAGSLEFTKSVSSSGRRRSWSGCGRYLVSRIRLLQASHFLLGLFSCCQSYLRWWYQLTHSNRLVHARFGSMQWAQWQ